MIREHIGKYNVRENNCKESEFIANKLSNSKAYQSYEDSLKSFNKQFQKTINEIETVIVKTCAIGGFFYQTTVFTERMVYKIYDYFTNDGYNVTYQPCDNFNLTTQSEKSFMIKISWDFEEYEQDDNTI